LQAKAIPGGQFHDLGEPIPALNSGEDKGNWSAAER